MKIPLLLLLFPLLSCCGPKLNTKIPSYDGKIWAGDSQKAAIVRTQENQAISCSEAQFQGYLCFSPTDFVLFYQTYVLGCRAWSENNLSTLKVEAKKNKDAVKVVKSVFKP